MTSEQSKMEILKKVEDGTLSVEEGAELLGILDNAASVNDHNSSDELVQEPSTIYSSTPSEHTVYGEVEDEKPRVSGCWKAGWSSILWVGAGITALSGYWMYSGYHHAGLSWGFWLSWIPFLFGILLLFVGVLLVQGRWLNVKIDSEKEGKRTKFTISVPLPLNFAAWIFKNFNQYMPEEIRDKNIGEMLEEMEKSAKNNEPFHVLVDDEQEGDHVEVSLV